MRCKRCLEEFEFEGCRIFIHGIGIDGNLCEVCTEELRELLGRFFMEVQMMKIN